MICIGASDLRGGGGGSCVAAYRNSRLKIHETI